MYTNKFTRIGAVSLLLLLGLNTACQKETIFLDKQNPSRLTDATFFKNETDAIYAINAAYAPLQSGYLYHTFYYSMMDVGIELSPTSNMPADWHISTYAFNAAHRPVLQVWTGLYQIIARANYALRGIERVPNLNPDLKKRLLGEARFLRGWAYFELVFNYGRVPLLTEFVNDAESSNQPRSATELEVYKQAIADFEFAEANLPTSYTGANIGRATRGAASGYLGKLYLYMASPGVNLDPQGYVKAETYFKKLTASGLYGLMDAYMDNFTDAKENNKESVFEVQFARMGGNSSNYNDHDIATVVEGTNRARTFGYLNWYNAFMNITFIRRFADSDPRLRFTAYGPPTPAHPEKMRIFNNLTYDRSDWSVRKYCRYDFMPAAQEDGDSPINFRVMRYADVLLMLAEALNEQGKSAEALPLINQVRTRVKMPALTLISQEALRQAIQDERLWELSLEQVRKKDVLRWGKAVAEKEFAMAGIAAFRYDLHRYLPIPQAEIDNNLAIDSKDQNPGY